MYKDVLRETMRDKGQVSWFFYALLLVLRQCEVEGQGAEKLGEDDLPETMH